FNLLTQLIKTLPMRTSFLGSGSKPLPGAAALYAPLLQLAVLAGGCASKNPLIDGPPLPAQASATAPGEAPGGVQTSRQRRFLGIFSPYRPDIQQGNFVSREMVSQLKPGMTPDQVRFVLGTPLLS